nr:chemokine [Human betaherpesvirus 6B]
MFIWLFIFFYAAYLGMAIGFIGSSPDAELSSENSRISSSVLSGCLLCCTD